MTVDLPISPSAAFSHLEGRVSDVKVQNLAIDPFHFKAPINDGILTYHSFITAYSVRPCRPFLPSYILLLVSWTRPSRSMPPINQYQRKEFSSPHEKHSRSPVTPAVTGLDYPPTGDGSTDLDSSGAHPFGMHQFYAQPNVAASSLDGHTDPPSNSSSLDQVWGAIRQQKERRMAKEKPKVQSLEEITQELLVSDQPRVPVPLMDTRPSFPKAALKKHKSMCVICVLSLNPIALRMDCH